MGSVRWRQIRKLEKNSKLYTRAHKAILFIGHTWVLKSLGIKLEPYQEQVLEHTMSKYSPVGYVGMNSVTNPNLIVPESVRDELRKTNPWFDYKGS